MSIKVLDIPFNKLLELKAADKEGDFIYMLEERVDFENHLGNFHAGVLFSVAESTSGEFLLNEYSDIVDEIIPVIRKAVVKYSKPGNGTIYSKACFAEGDKDDLLEELKKRKRVIMKVKSELFNEENERLMTAYFDWFVAYR